MGAGGGWDGGRFKVAVAHFLQVVSMVAAGRSKASRGWLMAVLESRSAQFFNSSRAPAWEFDSSAVIHRAVFPVYHPKQGTKYRVIAQVEIQMAHSNK